MGPTNRPQQMYMPHCWEPPFLFSVFLRGRHRPPNSPGHRHPRRGGSSLQASTSSANTARRLLFMVRRSFCELSKSAFIPLYCALVRPHQENAMEANSQNLRANISHKRRVQCLVTRHVPFEEWLRQFHLFSVERRGFQADPIPALKIFNDEVDLNPSDFFLRPPRTGLREHTYYY